MNRKELTTRYPDYNRATLGNYGGITVHSEIWGVISPVTGSNWKIETRTVQKLNLQPSERRCQEER